MEIPTKRARAYPRIRTRHELSIIHTMFQKKTEHLITYIRGGKCSKIDFILDDRRFRKNFKDCKSSQGNHLRPSIEYF